ncbi:hypothetical protein GW17_00044972 [Ensete ventricosum]|nr:hypothetical protein GW17_00044972 [Ensete ventricosum]
MGLTSPKDLPLLRPPEGASAGRLSWVSAIPPNDFFWGPPCRLLGRNLLDIGGRSGFVAVVRVHLIAAPHGGMIGMRSLLLSTETARVQQVIRNPSEKNMCSPTRY